MRPTWAWDSGSGCRGDCLRGRAAAPRALVVVGSSTMAGQVVMQGFLRRRIRCSFVVDHDAARADHPRPWGENPSESLVDQPGHAVAGHSICADPAAAVLQRPVAHGRARESPGDDRLAIVVVSVVITLNLFLLGQLAFNPQASGSRTLRAVSTTFSPDSQFDTQDCSAAR